MISVVLATYNGERYIYAQLESIRLQFRAADELVICDDGSVDATVSIIKKYIKKNSLEKKWHLYKNSSPKGCTRNFLDGVSLANGDLVFYSDQDDIWDNEKIYLMEKGFLKYKKMLVCSCEKTFINEKGEIINSVFFSRYKKIYRIGKKDVFINMKFVEAIKYNNSSGLCIAFKKKFMDDLKTFILNEKLPHDLPLGIIASVFGGYYHIRNVLVKHRIHTSNVSQPHFSINSRLQDKVYNILSDQNKLYLIEKILYMYKMNLSKRDLELLENAIQVLNKRIYLLQHNDLLGLFALLFSCNRMLERWKTLVYFICCFYNKLR